MCTCMCACVYAMCACVYIYVCVCVRYVCTGQVAERVVNSPEPASPPSRGITLMRV